MRTCGILIAILLLSACHSRKQEEERLPFFNTAEFDAEWIAPDDPRYSSIHTIDTFSLRDQRGATITKDSLDGFIYVANFFYTTCAGICPKMVNNLSAVQDSFALDTRIKLVSFSVMPWVDTVERLKEYSALHNIRAGKWYLLTGSKERIYDLGRHSYFAEKGLGLQKTNDQFLHTESMLLIDKRGRIRGIYNATQKTDIERVSDDIRTLLKES